MFFACSRNEESQEEDTEFQEEDTEFQEEVNKEFQKETEENKKDQELKDIHNQSNYDKNILDNLIPVQNNLKEKKCEKIINEQENKINEKKYT